MTVPTAQSIKTKTKVSVLSFGTTKILLPDDLRDHPGPWYVRHVGWCETLKFFEVTQL